MVKTLFNQILDETLELPDTFSRQLKEEIYDYIFGLTIEDPRKGRRTLFSVDDTVNYLSFLLIGCAHSFCFSEFHDRELNPFLFLAPCVLVDGKSFYKGLVSRFGIEVSENSKICYLSRASLERIETKYPDVKISVRLLIKKQTNAFKTWRNELSGITAKQRFLNFKESSPDLLRRSLRKHIAAHFDITQQSLSRIIKENS